MSTFKEYAFQTGIMLGDYVDSHYVGKDSLTRFETKLDAVLAKTASNSAASVVLTHKIVIKTDLADGSIANLRGMDCNTGKLLKGVDYLRQRIADALMTPFASQVLLRARGSSYPDLLDEPVNQSNALRVVAAAASVIRDPLSGVPDFELSNVFINRLSEADENEAGNEHLLTLVGDWYGTPVEVSV